MTSDTAPLSAMTQDQKIAYLAEKVMGWKKGDVFLHTLGKRVPAWIDSHGNGTSENWNPLADSNHWRQIEEELTRGSNAKVFNEFSVFGFNSVEEYVRTDLSDRVDALISAHQSLNA